MRKKSRTRCHIHRDLRTPKYRMRVIPDKSKKLPRKSKHKKGES